MPLNQILFDEQVSLIRAGVRRRCVAKDDRRAPADHDEGISKYVFRNPGVRVERKRSSAGENRNSFRLAVELSANQLTGVDDWARVWRVSRAEAVQRLFVRGLGTTSHLMRSS